VQDKVQGIYQKMTEKNTTTFSEIADSPEYKFVMVGQKRVLSMI
jgi:hypothetical protein